MFHLRIDFLVCVLLLAAVKLKAQKEITTFGIQFKPILSSELINTGPQTQQEGDINFTIEPRAGYAFGMVIRKDLMINFP